MSSETLIQPAFSQFAPKVNWQACPTDIAQWLSKHTRLSGRWQKMVTDHSLPIGYYRCDLKDQAFFVKVLNEAHAHLTQATYSLVSFLNDNIEQTQLEQEAIKLSFAVHVNSMPIWVDLIAPPFEGSNKEFPKVGIFILPLVTSEQQRFSTETMFALGKCVARLHQGLSKVPFADVIQSNFKSKQQVYLNLWQRIKADNFTLEIPSKAKEILISSSPAIFDIACDKQQVIHGDLNLGNLLFTKADEKTYIYALDFEDTLHSYGSPLLDIGLLLERILLSESANSEQLFDTFCRAYHKEYPDIIPDDIGWFKQIRQLLAIRALLILAALSERQGKLVLESEWQKFVKLYELSTI